MKIFQGEFWWIRGSAQHMEIKNWVKIKNGYHYNWTVRTSCGVWTSDLSSYLILDPIGLDAKKGSKVLSRGQKGLELGISRIASIRSLNPWQILENSSRNFPEISVFRGVTQTDFWKTHPVFFRNFNFRGMRWTDFWKIHPSILQTWLLD